jgi:hypothetical protein
MLALLLNTALAIFVKVAVNVLSALVLRLFDKKDR